MKENKISFVFTGVKEFEFIVDSSITSKDTTIEIHSGVDDDTHLPYILVKTDRHANKESADFFAEKASGGVTSGKGYPESLNFAIFGEIRIKMHGEQNVYPEFTAPKIVIGQGSYKDGSTFHKNTHNNWWISGDSMVTGLDANATIKVPGWSKKFEVGAMVQKCQADVEHGVFKSVFLVYTYSSKNEHEFTVNYVAPVDIFKDL